MGRTQPTSTSSSKFMPFVLIIAYFNHSALVVVYSVVRPLYAISELTLYSGHLVIAANKTWPIGGRIIEVPL